MTDFIFAFIILALLGCFAWYVREQGKERSKLLNALLAKDSQDYVNRTLAENTTIKPEVNGNTNLDLMPFDQLSDDQFDEHIQATLGNEVVDQEVT